MKVIRRLLRWLFPGPQRKPYVFLSAQRPPKQPMRDGDIWIDPSQRFATKVWYHGEWEDAKIPPGRP